MHLLSQEGWQRRDGDSVIKYLLHISESEWTLGIGDGQGGLAYYDSWGRKESDMTERLNWTELIHSINFPASNEVNIIIYILQISKVILWVKFEERGKKQSLCNRGKEKWKQKSLSPVQFFANPWTEILQARIL